MTHPVQLRSSSLREDGALHALADLAGAVDDWSSCRVVGAHMVAIHLAMSVVDVAPRTTADTDLAAPLSILAGHALAAGLLDELGYVKVKGKRLEREVDGRTASSICSRDHRQAVPGTTNPPVRSRWMRFPGSPMCCASRPWT